MAAPLPMTHLSVHRVACVDSPACINYVSSRRKGRTSACQKPQNCLWLACGLDWWNFCKKEGIRPRHSYQYAHVMGVDLQRLIRIESIEDAEAFVAKYGRQYVEEDEDLDGGVIRYTWHRFDWDAVRSAEHDKCGMFYNLDRRPPFDLELYARHDWYLGCDVTSAALWSHDCIVGDIVSARLRSG